MPQAAQRAARVLPGGVITSFDRGPQAAGLVIDEARGSKIYDVAGREYIDYVMAVGTALVGHAHPAVVRAVTNQIAKGSVYYVRSRQAIEFAELIVDAVPCGEQLRFAPSGGEANSYALRLACGYTGRRTILKFEGAYHGSGERLIASISPRLLIPFPTAETDSEGTLPSLMNATLVAPYNDLATTEALVRQSADDLAAIIVEPVQRSYAPKPGFLEGLRRLASQVGAVLIFDEIVTGFRLAWAGAQGYYGVVPDIATYGKVIGGGFPIGAVVGRKDLMKTFEPSSGRRGIFSGSTFLGNPVSAVAGMATLKLLQERGTYEALFECGNRTRESLRSALVDSAITATVTGLGPFFHVYFKDGPIETFRDTQGERTDLATVFFERCIHHGAVLSHSSKSHISLAHDDRDLRRTSEIFHEAARETAAGAAARL